MKKVKLFQVYIFERLEPTVNSFIAVNNIDVHYISTTTYTNTDNLIVFQATLLYSDKKPADF